MNKSIIAKSILFSLASPVIVGLIIALYYSISLSQASSTLFLQIMMSAIANAHIVGMTMAVCIVPAYIFLLKRDKVSYSAILTVGMLGGAVFSYLFSASGGAIFLVNTVMALLAAGIFLFSLRYLSPHSKAN